MLNFDNEKPKVIVKMSKTKKKIEALLKRIGKLNDKLKKLRTSGAKKKKKSKKTSKKKAPKKTTTKKTTTKKRVAKRRAPASPATDTQGTPVA